MLASCLARGFAAPFAVFLLALALALPARAGDIASRRILGFSPDGTRFAFEEYGIQDGSGFPYANIYVVDTVRNRWIDGTPFRVLLQDERASLEEARRRAASRAARLLHRLQITPRGETLAQNPVTELSADPHSVTVAVRPGYPTDASLTFTLTEFPLASRRCARYTDQPTRGYRLYIAEGQGRRRLLHADKRIPKSRGCPLNYAISDILHYRPSGNRSVYVVIISVFRVGFEGPDRRFIAAGYRLRR